MAALNSSLKGTRVFGVQDEFADEMRRIVASDEFSDITFIVGEEKDKIHAHKVILAARCEVFRAMFAEQKNQAKSKGKPVVEATNIPLILPDVRATVFLTVLEYIYTNSCKLTQTVVVDVLASAIEYGLLGLANCCTEYIINGLRVETACEAMQAGITYQQPKLRDTCLAFIEEHTSLVFKSKAFVEMSEDTLAFILKSDNLKIDEKDVLAAVREWGTVNAVVASKSLADVLKVVIEHVRFPLLDEESLHKIEAENEKTPIIPVKLIAKAWKFIATGRADATDPQFRPRAGTHM